jgi:hypothetical protein
LHCGRRAIDARTIEAVGTCGALWDVGTCGARSELRLISREAGFPPLVAKLALLERMNGAWDCFAQGIA